jgi:hypothetical protein
MASAFAQGMESGTRLAKSWLDTYNTVEEKTRKRRAAEEIAAAGTTSLADLPEQPRVYTLEAPAAPAAPALGTGAYGTEEDYTSIQPQGLVRPQPAAPAATPPGTGFARGYTADQTQAVRSAYATGGAPAAERAATAQGVPTQGLTRPIPMSQQLARQADIYARNGLTDQAEQYRLKAYDVSRQEEQDARTREADARTKADYEQKQNTNNAAQWMAEQISTGRTADMTLIAEAQTKYKGDYNTLLSTTANVLGITEKIAKQKTEQLVNQINEAVLGGDESFNKLLGSFADPNKEDNITPKLMQVKGGVQVMYGNKPMSPLFTGADGISPLQQAGAFYINTAQGKPFETAIQMQNLAKGAAQIKASEAQVRASDSTVGLNSARAGQIRQMNDALATNLKNSEEAKAIQAEFAALDDTNDPGGAKRQSLITQFNMLSVKAGGTIPVSGGGKKGSVLQTPVELKKNDDGTYTAYSKDGGRALYNTYNGEEIPLGMEVDTYRGMKDAAKKNRVGLVTGEENGRLVVKFIGADGKYYDDAEKAKYAKPAKSAAQPGGLDTSRTPVVQPAAEPTAPTPKPEKRSGETQTAFRERLIAWDNNRMAYERLMTEQRLKGQLSGNAAGLRRPLVD